MVEKKEFHTREVARKFGFYILILLIMFTISLFAAIESMELLLWFLTGVLIVFLFICDSIRKKWAKGYERERIVAQILKELGPK